MNTSKFLKSALLQNDMKFQYASDLHLELSGNSRWIKHHPLAVSGDVLILAGDIIYLGDDGGLKHPFWDWCADNFEQTIVVPGNHEYYGGFNLAETLDNWSLELRSNVRYLNNAAVRFGRTSIVLSTLWSHIRVENALAVKSGITDFHRIRYGEDRLDFVKFNEVHQKSVDFVRTAVKEAPDDDIIVVSHHLPSQILVSDRFKGSILNDAFSSEQGNWIAESKIKYWIYGHSHVNIPGQIGQTTFLSNQLGYVFDHPEATGFDNGTAIEIR